MDREEYRRRYKGKYPVDREEYRRRYNKDNWIPGTRRLMVKNAPDPNRQWNTEAIVRISTDFEHPMRCKNPLRGGRLCRKWKMKGENKCRRCLRGNRKQSRSRLHKGTFGNDMARKQFYAKALGPKLGAFVTECMEDSETDQLSLLEDLAVMRGLATDAARMHAMAECIADNNPNKNALLIEAGSVMKSALSEVRVMALSAQTIISQRKDTISATALHEVVTQITRMVAVCFDQYPEALAQFK